MSDAPPGVGGVVTDVLRRIRAGWLPHAVGPERSSWWWGRPRGDGFHLWAEGLVPSMSVVEPMTDAEVEFWTAHLHPMAQEVGR